MSRPLLEIREVGDITVSNFLDPEMLDITVIDHVGSSLLDLVREMGRTKLLVSFKGVKFLGSWIQTHLINLNNELKGVGGKLVVCEVNNQLFEAFDLTGLPIKITFVTDEETGLKAF